MVGTCCPPLGGWRIISWGEKRAPRKSAAGFRVEAPRVAWRVLDAVRDAAVQLGVPAIEDFNCGRQRRRLLFSTSTRKRGRRWSRGPEVFLKPALARRNLNLEMHVPGRALDHRERPGLRPSCSGAKARQSRFAPPAP